MSYREEEKINGQEEKSNGGEEGGDFEEREELLRR